MPIDDLKYEEKMHLYLDSFDINSCRWIIAKPKTETSRHNATQQLHRIVNSEQESSMQWGILFFESVC